MQRSAPMNAVKLTTEYLKDPIGISVNHPRFSWVCSGGKKQSAYRIIAEDVSGKLLWDSEKTESDKMTFVEYPVRVESRQRVMWKVKLWDENGEEGDWSETAFFESGLVAEDWVAHWISGNYRANRRKRYPVDCFKKDFECKKTVASARLYMTACGLYSAQINGKCCSMPLAPGVSEYKKRIQYQTYDVTDLISCGKNSLCVFLADGWYRGSVGAWGLRNQYGTQTKLLGQLEIRFSDGTEQIVSTDSSWRWSNDGELLFADNKDGERVDANMAPTYSYYAKETVCSVIPSESNNVPIAEKERFKPRITLTPSGKTLLDFGQNIAGYIEFEVTAKKGQRINIEFGELLENGELTLKNIQCSSKKKTTPLQRIEYICKDGVNRYKTRFAIFGFRYACVETDVEDIAEEKFTAVAVYSDMPETGYFNCSNGLINSFVDATKWSLKSNSTDLPTDCPTRERHGWTGDAQIFCKTASYLFDYATFAEKFVNDMCDEQRRNGNFRQIAPKGGVDFYMNFMDGSPGWSDAGVFIPYRLYEQYRDIGMLERFYPNMRRFAQYKIKTLGKWYPTALPTGVGIRYARNIVNYGQSYGEWAEPADVKKFAVKDFISPHPEETTAYFVHMLKIMEKTARLLGKPDDAKRYGKYADRARKGYQKLVSTKKYSLDTDRQAKLVRPLYFGLLDEKQEDFAKRRLITALENYGWRLGTGFLSTPLILKVLADIDIEYAYRLLENEQMPGWLFMTKNGATTVWESWEGTRAQGGIASLNHYSKGAVCEWLFSEACGMKIGGENRFVISPHPGGTLEFADGRYDSIFGTVSVYWKKAGDGYSYRIEIPSNCEAEIMLPDGRRTAVGAGIYEF